MLDEEMPGAWVDVSVLVPLLNEAESLPGLHEDLTRVLERTGRSWEIVYCDDGSTDQSFEVLRGLSQDPRVRVLRFRRNFGQTAAMAAGFDHARGDVVIPIDADRQNDPQDIPLLLEKIEEGWDVVSGWRRDRKDPFLTVTLPSRVGNAIIGRVTGLRLHDYGCTLTAYRREISSELMPMGEMHRFLPAWAAAKGARVTEIPVAHHPRRHGRSKYGLSKTLRVILDLLTVRFVTRYGDRPLHCLGRLAFGLAILGLVMWGIPPLRMLVSEAHWFSAPLFVAGLLFFLSAVHMVVLGLLAELHLRASGAVHRRRVYSIEETINLEQQTEIGLGAEASESSAA